MARKLPLGVAAVVCAKERAFNNIMMIMMITVFMNQQKRKELVAPQACPSGLRCAQRTNARGPCARNPRASVHR